MNYNNGLDKINKIIDINRNDGKNDNHKLIM